MSTSKHKNIPLIIKKKWDVTCERQLVVRNVKCLMFSIDNENH